MIVLVSRPPDTDPPGVHATTLAQSDEVGDHDLELPPVDSAHYSAGEGVARGSLPRYACAPVRPRPHPLRVVGLIHGAASASASISLHVSPVVGYRAAPTSTGRIS